MKGRDIGEEVLVRGAILNGTAVAAGTGDATEITGLSIDRVALGNLYESCKLAIHGNATLQSGETHTIIANIQDSADNSTWADYGTALGVTTVLDAAGGALSAVAYNTFVDYDLRDARQYIRAQVTPNHIATGTDTSTIAAEFIFGGGQVYPAT